MSKFYILEEHINEQGTFDVSIIPEGTKTVVCKTKELKRLPNDFPNLKGSLNLSKSSIQELSLCLKIGKNLTLSEDILSLSPDLKVGRKVDLSRCKKIAKTEELFQYLMSHEKRVAIRKGREFQSIVWPERSNIKELYLARVVKDLADVIKTDLNEVYKKYDEEYDKRSNVGDQKTGGNDQKAELSDSEGSDQDAKGGDSKFLPDISYVKKLFDSQIDEEFVGGGYRYLRDSFNSIVSALKKNPLYLDVMNDFAKIYAERPTLAILAIEAFAKIPLKSTIKEKADLSKWLRAISVIDLSISMMYEGSNRNTKIEEGYAAKFMVNLVQKVFSSSKGDKEFFYNEDKIDITPLGKSVENFRCVANEIKSQEDLSSIYDVAISFKQKKDFSCIFLEGLNDEEAMRVKEQFDSFYFDDKGYVIDKEESSEKGKEKEDCQQPSVESKPSTIVNNVTTRRSDLSNTIQKRRTIS